MNRAPSLTSATQNTPRGHVWHMWGCFPGPHHSNVSTCATMQLHVGQSTPPPSNVTWWFLWTASSCSVSQFTGPCSGPWMLMSSLPQQNSKHYFLAVLRHAGVHIQDLLRFYTTFARSTVEYATQSGTQASLLSCLTKWRPSSAPHSGPSSRTCHIGMHCCTLACLHCMTGGSACAKPLHRPQWQTLS